VPDLWRQLVEVVERPSVCKLEAFGGALNELNFFRTFKYAINFSSSFPSCHSPYSILRRGNGLQIQWLYCICSDRPG